MKNKRQRKKLKYTSKTNSFNQSSNMIVDIKIINEKIRNYLPSYGTIGSAAADLRACIDEPITLKPGETILVPTGFAFYLKDVNYASIILPRSGLGHKSGIILGNTIGLIDSDYQGEMMISVWNRSKEIFTINPLDRIAQLAIIPIKQFQYNIVDSFEESERGEGGFGHTGHQ